MPYKKLVTLLLVQILTISEYGWTQDQRRATAEVAQRHQQVAERRNGIHIICHRGAVEFAHENTLEAYRAAFELGANGNEIDIRATN